MGFEKEYFDSQLRAMQQRGSMAQGIGGLRELGQGFFGSTTTTITDHRGTKPEEKKEKTIREELQEETDIWLDQAPKYRVRL